MADGSWLNTNEKDTKMFHLLPLSKISKKKDGELALDSGTRIGSSGTKGNDSSVTPKQQTKTHCLGRSPSNAMQLNMKVINMVYQASLPLRMTVLLIRMCLHLITMMSG